MPFCTCLRLNIIQVLQTTEDCSNVCSTASSALFSLLSPDQGIAVRMSSDLSQTSKMQPLARCGRLVLYYYFEFYSSAFSSAVFFLVNVFSFLSHSGGRWSLPSLQLWMLNILFPLCSTCEALDRLFIFLTTESRFAFKNRINKLNIA